MRIDRKVLFVILAAGAAAIVLGVFIFTLQGVVLNT